MNPVLTIPQMTALEKQAFADGVDPWNLTQQVGVEMVRAIRQRFPVPGVCRVFSGRGNNGGDAWVVARLLDQEGWSVEVECPFSPEEMSPLATRAMKKWDARAPSRWSQVSDTRPNSGQRPLLVIDGLLGIGMSGQLRSPVREMVVKINDLRNRGAVVFALDLPSGLGSDLCVVADHTLTVGFGKTVLLDDSATLFVGRISVLEIPDLCGRFKERSVTEILTARGLAERLPPRSFEFHKGMAGRVALVAGSHGMIGAAVLAASGALRAGAGLVHVFCPTDIYSSLAVSLPPEVMVRPWDEFSIEKMDVLAIGPGLDIAGCERLWLMLHSNETPLVIDAGALGLLSEHPEFLAKCRSPILLTPHPGEMERLYPRAGRSRVDWSQDFISTMGNENTTLLLKGARTVIAAPGRPVCYNSTGHPGMATGGMGDVLTGVCAALVAQKLTPFDAAGVGAWVCGRAAEIALEVESESQESLLPTDVLRCLGRAFSDLRADVY